MGSEGKAGLPALHEAAKDENSDVRTAAMLAIGRIGPDAKAAIPMLIPLLKSEKAFCSCVCRKTLVGLGLIRNTRGGSSANR